jgi:hypothetical protein
MIDDKRHTMRGNGGKMPASGGHIICPKGLGETTFIIEAIDTNGNIIAIIEAIDTNGNIIQVCPHSRVNSCSVCAVGNKEPVLLSLDPAVEYIPIFWNKGEHDGN